MRKGLFAQAAEFFGLGAEEEGGRHRSRHLASEEAFPGLDEDVVQFPRTPEHINCPIVRAEPHTLEEAASVADEIKRQNPVILNLEGVEKAEARRIRDFIGGVTYGLNGYMRKVGSWVYMCAPFDMPVEKLVMDRSRKGWERFEAEEDETLADY